MNPYFSPARFGRLTRTYFIENRAALLLNIALLAATLVILALFVYSNYPFFVPQKRITVLFLLGVPAWGIFTVQQVNALTVKERAITYLLRPASQFEKYLLVLLVSGLGFLLVYSLLFILVDAVGVSFVNHRNWTPTQLASIKEWENLITIKPVYVTQDTDMSGFPNIILAAAILIHPLALALSFLFRRFTLSLVALTIVALFAIGFFSNSFVQSWLFSGVEVLSSFPFSDPVLKYESAYRTLELPQPIGTQLQYLVGVTVVILLYLTAYYRLKEQEV